MKLNKRQFLIELETMLETYIAKHNVSVATHEWATKLRRKVQEQVATIPEIYPDAQRLPEALETKLSEAVVNAIMEYESEDSMDIENIQEGDHRFGVYRYTDGELVEAYYGLTTLDDDIIKELETLGYPQPEN